ncbi:hypothetical protein HYH03_009558 [Edaphochlamys debaryana]|uniref:Uncharacterized protein n=1 Tax=Edaphochlamys debaryana TaxID=47281 RepID=A0A835XY54_9CHLO|nr:hypothetical protein HYH03_009558 [Edaphochlamys debaryana]|eukprot:KAG2492060.1 hypothetical protein HYH03_009558 [Edaphochlamys debaryana]
MLDISLSSLDDLDLRARSNSTSTWSCSLASVNQDAADFAAEGGVVEVDIAKPVGNLSSRLRVVEGVVAELKGVVAELAFESKGYRAIGLRHVVQAAHLKLGKRFGPKAEGQSWFQYLTGIQTADPDYFKRNNIEDCLDLLMKGPNTPYEAGNRAAHEPPPELIQIAVNAATGPGADWQAVWRFVRS